MQFLVNHAFTCISIHALRVEGDGVICKLSVGFLISIHALRVEGDLEDVARGLGFTISIHALRVEGDCVALVAPGLTGVFLSTPSVWRATAAG